MNTLKTIQEEIKDWSTHNFGAHPSWHPLLGIQEEVGELSHHYLKQVQGIRTNENHREEIKDALADTLIFMLDFCNAENIDLEAELIKVWSQVKQRNWKANPSEG